MKAAVQKCGPKWWKPKRKCPVPLPRRFVKESWGILDYYNLKNIQADTDMRDSIAKLSGKDQDKGEK